MTNRHMCSMAAIGIIGVSLLFPRPAVSAGEGNCLIHPYVVITVTTPVGGILETVAVDRGDLVKEGQIVATLDTSVERATGAVAHAQAELSNRRLADLELQRTSAEVNMRTIRSPINGVVVERFMSPGEYPKQEKILKLAQLHPLRVEAYVPISMLGKITVGMEVQVKPEDPVGGMHKAKVTVVDHVVDAGSGTLGIRMELPNPDLRIPAGLKCTVRFPQKQEKNGAATDSTTTNKDR